MNKKKLAKLEGQTIRLMPVPQNRTADKATAFRNNLWILLPAPADGKGPEVQNTVTDHKLRLYYDRIKEYQEPNILILRGQIFLDGAEIQYEPFVGMAVQPAIDLFKLQLYDRRLVIYQTIRAFLGRILRDGKTSYKDCLSLLRETDESKFLFGSDMQEYIQLLYAKGIELIRYQRLLFGPDKYGVGPERSEVAQKESDLLIWFAQQITTSEP